MRYKLSTATQKIILPVNPPKFEFKTAVKIDVVEIIDVGERSIPGNKKLKQASISRFFPAQVYPFAYYENGFIQPMEYIKTILEWEESGQNIIVEVDGFDKIQMNIVTFDFGVRDGTGDIYYTMTLKESIPLRLRAVGAVVDNIQEDVRIEKAVANVEYVVKSGDTLSKIAKKYTGDSGNWKKIASANGVNDPRTLQVGQRLVIT